MREKEEVSEPYQQEARETRTLNSVSTEVLCYRGKGESPRWTDLDAGECPAHPLPHQLKLLQSSSRRCARSTRTRRKLRDNP